MKIIGWMKHGVIIPDPVGYIAEYYWDADGHYLGPDADGIEPIVDE